MNRVQTAQSHTHRTIQSFYLPPRTTGQPGKRSTLQNVVLPSVIPELTGGRKKTSKRESIIKIPRELPLSSSPLRNSYEITRDMLMTNMFKHTAFSPAMLTNHHKKVLEGVIDPEHPVLGSTTHSRPGSSTSLGAAGGRKKSMSPLRCTLLASVGVSSGPKISPRHVKSVQMQKEQEQEENTKKKGRPPRL